MVGLQNDSSIEWSGEFKDWGFICSWKGHLLRRSKSLIIRLIKHGTFYFHTHFLSNHFNRRTPTFGLSMYVVWKTPTFKTFPLCLFEPTAQSRTISLPIKHRRYKEVKVQLNQDQGDSGSEMCWPQRWLVERKSLLNRTMLFYKLVCDEEEPKMRILHKNSFKKLKWGDSKGSDHRRSHRWDVIFFSFREPH